MAIRINLLAEQQAAEEMRRRDPIKRAVLAGAALLALIVVWIGATQLSVNAARNELGGYETKLKELEKSSKLVRASQIASLDADGRIKSLDRYANNRFFWGTFLDALQSIGVENIRLVEVKAGQRNTLVEANRLFTTNLVVDYQPPAPFWKFWAPSQQQDVQTLVSNVLAGVTNAGPFLTNTIAYNINITPNNTNLTARQIVTTVEFNNVPWAVERTTVEIRGRDYGQPFGGAIDEFARRLNSSAYFKELIEPGQGFRFTERPPQPRLDPQDVATPGAMFVPFTIELAFKERVLKNE